MKMKFSIFLTLFVIAISANIVFAQRYNRDYTALYRFYNKKSNNHLYTTDCKEKEDVLRGGEYVYEGVEGYVSPTQRRGTIPLYRLYLGGVRHFYTIDYTEANNLQRDYSNKSEGIAGYVSERKTRDTMPFYRLYGNNRHFYTTDEQEKNSVMQNGSSLESIAGYLFTSGRNDCDYGAPIDNGTPVLYAGTNFDGAAVAIDRDWSDNQDWDGSPNTIRSIRVPQGWYLVIYTKKNYGGKSYNINSNITFAPGDQWYNKIRSIKVYRGNPPIQPR